MWASFDSFKIDIMDIAEKVLRFWFGDDDIVEATALGRFDLWFGKSPETDGVVKEKFLESVERAGRGEYDSWQMTSKGCLALIVLLDQFPRNIFRDTPRMFEYDEKVLASCLGGLQTGVDKDLNPFEKLFFYMPMEHSEKIECQELSLKYFEKLLDESPEDFKQTFKTVYDYAVRHHEIIRKFGRFPHRNKILGRESTDEEVEFLKEPGSSF